MEQIAWGGTFERSDDGVTYTAVPRVRGIVLPTPTQEYKDVTSLDSPNGFREFIKGLRDIGEIQLVCGYTRDGYVAWRADEARADATYFRGTLPVRDGETTGDAFEFRAFPTATPKADDAGEPMTIEITLRGTGDFDFTAGS